MPHSTQIIKKPLITEKASWESNHPQRRRYSFLVDKHATKPQIKAAVEEIYNVRVEAVSTQVRKGKSFRNRYGLHESGDWKKAAVKLHPDDRIELF